jgi:hypothetical protein
MRLPDCIEGSEQASDVAPTAPSEKSWADIYICRKADERRGYSLLPPVRRLAVIGPMSAAMGRMNVGLYRISGK